MVQQSRREKVPGLQFPQNGLFLMRLRRDPLSALEGLARTYGDVAHMKIGLQDAYLLSHPEDIRDVLVVRQQQMRKPGALRQPLGGNGLLRSEGEFHKQQRRLIQPAFHRQRIAGYAQTMVEYTQRLSERWRDGLQVDMAQEMMGLTLAIIAQTMFGASVEDDTEAIRQALTTLLQMGGASRLDPLNALLEYLPLPDKKRRGEALARLDAIVYRIIDERRASGEDRGDLLSMLLLARDEEGDGHGMSDTQLRDEVMTLFVAGHETTANALAWTWYLLAQHPEVEEELQRELDTVLGDRLPGLADVPRLTYTEMVLSEAMRLYPPAWTIGRRTVAEYRLRQYTIPADSLLIMSQYVVHHDPRWYPDPYRFDPQRWTPAERAARPKYAYFPFGGGPRLCIGEAFAWMEGELALAILARRWRARLLPGHRVQSEPLITLRPRGGLPMMLHKRPS